MDMNRRRKRKGHIEEDVDSMIEEDDKGKHKQKKMHKFVVRKNHLRM
jgi:hypothetical protein